MKVGVVITGLGVGGAENHLLKVLPKVKFPFFVVSLTNENAVGRKLVEKGIKVYYLGLNRFNLLSVVFRFRRIIKKERPDVLNSYLIHADIFTRIFGRMFGVKKIICSVRNKYINNPFLLFFDRISSGLVDLYLPNSNSVADFIISKGFDPKKIKVLPNGIDLKNFPIVKNKSKLKKKLDLDGKFVVGTVGSLMPKKDHETLIRAFSGLKVKDKVLVIIGEGPLRSRLKKLSVDLKVPVQFLGNRDDAKEIMQVFDVFVLSSLHEGMSNALLEAMYAKVPVVVSGISENKELVGSEDGLIFRVGDWEDLLKKVVLVYENGSEAKRMALNAHKKIVKEYSVDKVVNEYEKLLGGV